MSGNGEVEPLERAPVGEIKIIAVDVVQRDDAPLVCLGAHDLIVVTAFVEVGAALVLVDAHERIDLHDHARGIELGEGLARRDVQALGRLRRAGAVEAVLRDKRDAAVFEIIGAAEIVGLQLRPERGGAGRRGGRDEKRYDEEYSPQNPGWLN